MLTGMPADSAIRRMSFDRNAVAYQQGRPPYPHEVYELLTVHYGLSAGCKVVEIGAGTGITTSQLLSRGALVTAVEPGAALAGFLRARLAGDRLRVVHADFENADLPPASFDLAVAATSWHWVDATTGVPKVATLVRPGGGFAIWWTIFGDPDRPHTEFRSLLDPLYARYMPGEVDDGRPPKPMRTEQWLTQLQAGGWFTRPGIDLIRWTQPLTRVTAAALWATFPNVAELAAADRAAFLAGVADAVDAAGGHVDDPRLTIVYHSRRTQLT
jgi:SAM-dependent methyltransferase